MVEDGDGDGDGERTVARSLLPLLLTLTRSHLILLTVTCLSCNFLVIVKEIVLTGIALGAIFIL